jgi:branched-chain amino acid aminotransferase
MIVSENGVLCPATSVRFGITNRSFRYGDGCFESIRLVNGKAPFLKYHFNRLSETTDVLKLELPASFTHDYFEKQIQALVEANALMEGGYIRLTVFRHDGGFYLPGANNASFVMEAYSLDHNHFQCNTNGLTLGLFHEIPKPKGLLANFKTNNSLVYVLASIYCKEHGFDDCLLVNEDGNIVESTNSNVFMLLDGEIITPPLSEGCLGGVARKVLLELLQEKGEDVFERAISVEQAMKAEEIIVTNAVRGPRWTQGLGQGQMNRTQQWNRWLNERVGVKVG